MAEIAGTVHRRVKKMILNTVFMIVNLGLFDSLRRKIILGLDPKNIDIEVKHMI